MRTLAWIGLVLLVGLWAPVGAQPAPAWPHVSTPDSPYPRQGVPATRYCVDPKGGAAIPCPDQPEARVAQAPAARAAEPAIVNPTAVEFTLSLDHTPTTSYEVGWFLPDAATPAQSTTIPATLTQHYVPGATYAQALPRPISVPVGQWVLRARTLGGPTAAQWSEWSAPSPPFSYLDTPAPAPRPPGPPTLRVGSSPGTGGGSLVVGIDDTGQVYWDGARVGEVATWNQPLRVTVPATSGPHLLAIAAINAAGAAGGVAWDLVVGPRHWASGVACKALKLPQFGSSEPLGWTMTDYDDTVGWTPVVQYGTPGVAPYTSMTWPSGSQARFVWVAEAQWQWVLVRCRVEV